MKQPAVYIVTNRTKSVLYVGVTSNLVQRIHKTKSGYYENSFTEKYQCNYLIYYEVGDSMEQMILREKQIKKYRREKKEALINSMNPFWNDLYGAII